MRKKPYIHGDVVTKYRSPELARIEAAKTIEGSRIGQETGLFIVPELVDFDEQKGILVFRRIRGMRGLTRLLAFKPDTEDLLSRAGRALAAIHENMLLEDSMRKPLPGKYECHNGASVFLHGDYWPQNIQICGRAEPLIILDWESAPELGSEPTHGTPYFDLLWFIKTLFERPLPRFAFCEPPAPQARVFIEEYARATGSKFSNGCFAEYARRFFANRPLSRFAGDRPYPGSDLIGLYPMRERLRIFLRSLDSWRVAI